MMSFMVPKSHGLDVCPDDLVENRDIVPCHARRRKSLFEHLPDSPTIKFGHVLQRLNRLVYIVNDESAQSIVDHFRNRAMAGCNYRGPAGHRLEADETERLG